LVCKNRLSTLTVPHDPTTWPSDITVQQIETLLKGHAKKTTPSIIADAYSFIHLNFKGFLNHVVEESRETLQHPVASGDGQGRLS
jgi:hypothetical protein